MARSKAGRCVYFTGIQNKVCKAGVTYQDGRLPCLTDLKGLRADAPAPWPCDKYQEPTQEQIDADEAEFQAHMDKMRVVMAVVKPWRTWTKKNRVAKQEAIDCPTGCGGKLHLSQAAYNGHVWGKCTTDGCVSWME